LRILHFHIYIPFRLFFMKKIYIKGIGFETVFQLFFMLFIKVNFPFRQGDNHLDNCRNSRILILSRGQLKGSGNGTMG
jgi:hypothetical protein